jgi:hypothetical protein
VIAAPIPATPRTAHHSAPSLGNRKIRAAPNLDVVDAGVHAKRLFAAAARGLDDESLRPLGHAQHLGGERGVKGVAAAEKERHTADDRIGLRHGAEAPISGRRGLNFG